jgi:hypothetical protein
MGKVRWPVDGAPTHVSAGGIMHVIHVNPDLNSPGRYGGRAFLSDWASNGFRVRADLWINVRPVM